MNPTVSPSLVARNLLAVVDLLSIYPSHTVYTALDRLGLDPSTVPTDLLDLQGADACEAIEAEVVILSLREAA